MIAPDGSDQPYDFSDDEVWPTEQEYLEMGVNDEYYKIHK